MFGLGIWEIALLCIALLVFVRPEELPKVMGKLGQWYGRVTGSSRYIMRRLQEPFELDDEQAAGEVPEGSENSIAADGAIDADSAINADSAIAADNGVRPAQRKAAPGAVRRGESETEGGKQK